MGKWAKWKGMLLFLVTYPDKETSESCPVCIERQMCGIARCPIAGAQFSFSLNQFMDGFKLLTYGLGELDLNCNALYTYSKSLEAMDTSVHTSVLQWRSKVMINYSLPQIEHNLRLVRKYSRLQKSCNKHGWQWKSTINWGKPEQAPH